MNESNNRPDKRRAAPGGRPAPGRRTASGAHRAAPEQGTPQKGGHKKKHSKSVWAKVLRVFAVLMSICVIIGSVLAVMVSMYVVRATANDDQLLNLDNIKMSYSTIIYANNPDTGAAEEYARLVGESHRVWVDLADMPAYLPKAFIAIEDKTFPKHNGINFKRTISATANLVLRKLSGGAFGLYKSEQGASTIDQQLIKNITGDDSHDPMRKVREIFRAISLENKYSKDMILEAYLNTVSFVGNTGGVAGCASNLFNKSVQDLSLKESVCIAAITNNPTKYNPRINPENNQQRCELILKNMLKEGYITQADHDAAMAEQLSFVDTTAGQSEEIQSQNSYFTDQVIEDVITDLVEQKGMTRNDASAYLYNGGLRIYATVDTKLQSAMEQVMVNEPGGELFPDRPNTYKDPVTGEEKTENVQGCMVTVGYDGSLLGVVGGLGAKTTDRGFNRATQAHRQTGSTMKPLGAYALGIDYNYINYSYSLNDSYVKQINDGGEIRDWPRNYAGEPSNTDMLVADALAKSINTIAVRAGMFVGESVLYDFMSNTLGISTLASPKDVDLGPLVLGSMTHGVPPVEMANAYSMFGNGGTITPVHSYTTVEEVQSGEVILDNTALVKTRAISSDTAMVMNKLLGNVLKPGGTAGSIGAPKGGLDAVGKTGTTSNDKDHWFIGLTPYYCTAAWMGYDSSTPLPWKGSQYSKHPPTLAWKSVMEIAQDGKEAIAFPTSDNVETLTYCKTSGGIATGACPETATGYYKKDGNKPEACTVHGG
ncbi:MAG: transglycosylase domain-containing protein [Pygmaiobacter sp.]